MPPYITPSPSSSSCTLKPLSSLSSPAPAVFVCSSAIRRAQMRPPAPPGGPGPGPPGPPGPFLGPLGGFFDGLYSTISSCFYVVCCCWLIQDCFNPPPPPAPSPAPAPPPAPAPAPPPPAPAPAPPPPVPFYAPPPPPGPGPFGPPGPPGGPPGPPGGPPGGPRPY